MSDKLKLLFIVNPKSGVKKKVKLPELINRYIDKNKFDVEIQLTTHGGHATEIAREAVEKKVSIVVAAGGDGTMNEVAKALMHSDATMGIIPMGSGNGLARHLKIPMDTIAAIKTINGYRSTIIDVCYLNERPFFCTAGIGFDAHVGDRFAVEGKRGLSTYIKIAFRELRKYKAQEYIIKTDNSELKTKAFIVSFANAAQYGNNAFIAPDANIQDGLLDVSIIKPFPKYALPSFAWRLFQKKLGGAKYFHSIQTNKCTVFREQEGPVHLDGEPITMEKTLTVHSTSSALKIIVGAAY